MEAEVVGGATLPDLRVKVVDVLSSDSVLEPIVGMCQFIDKVVPDFSLIIDQRWKLVTAAAY
jgi:hypothetical protein